ncbi:MAG TPA: DUF58 domain-containing protein [Candidatus Hydrogenedentes bacterium]|jgi:uncharacterized protein (DUF58 family)|nr:DUF58 domain-containing protein [Candidatus Hydrogenedentota bacterium]HOM48495.1 DUF58 domain-containing protein [Candidatus Hydrogenedentota bacterium]HOR51481.1 DUF58 domain-containing protein [Candidatus Hydrogenedentota bacterium]HPK25309.1 DUF58 domain-containing protein [Candidatus Hydrogenedentota bacterium]HQB03054.1 DUF58 domain-containing protein [Candidatus Hydrogenedentota bacterium]
MISQDAIKKIRRIQIRTRRTVNEILAGQYQSAFKGQGMEFREVRSYVPGDDIRSIDWNVTARTGEPHVKVMAEERELTVALLVDMSGSGRFGSVSRLKNELAAELCAVLALSAINNNDKVSLLIFTDDLELYVPPQKGSRHVLRIIREVLYFQPKGRATNITRALNYLNRVISRKAVVFLVSDFMDQGYEDALRVTAKRHDVIAVSVSDPREMSLPDVGRVAVADAETGREILINTGDRKLREAYAQKAREETAAREEIFRRNRIDSLRLSTDKSYVDELYRFFKLRERRRAGRAAL